MKVKAICMALFLCNILVHSQISGNINYTQTTKVPQSYINAAAPAHNQIFLSIKRFSQRESGCVYGDF